MNKPASQQLLLASARPWLSTFEQEDTIGTRELLEKRKAGDSIRTNFDEPKLSGEVEYQ